MKSWFQKLRDSLKGGPGASKQSDYINVEPEEAAAGVTGDKPQTGLLSRLQHGSKRDQQIAALQAGYSELLELIRAIRQHLDAQSEAQEKVLESMDKFNDTLSLMDQTSRKSAQTMIELARKTRDSEDLLRTMVVRSERRLTILMGLLLVILLAILGFGIYFGYGMMERGGSSMAATEVNVVDAAESVSEEPEETAPAPSKPKDPESLQLSADEALELSIGQATIENAAAEAVTEDESEPTAEPAIEEAEEAEEAEQAEQDKGLFGGRRGFLFFRRSE